MIEEPKVKSPCISICVLNEDDVCEGCYRSVLEVTDWVMYNDEEKLAVLEKCRLREREINSHLTLNP